MKKLLFVALLAGVCFAQTPTPPAPKKFYRLDFVVREMDGDQVINSRNYSTTASTQNQLCSIRAGSKVPVNTGNSVQEYLVGVYIDCRSLEDRGDQLDLFVSASVSSFADPSEKPGSPRVVRDNRWESQVVLPLRKPTILFSSDDPSSKRKMQLVLTATPIP
jgi:hypothetical protein